MGPVGPVPDCVVHQTGLGRSGQKESMDASLSPILPCWVQAVAEDTILKASETCARGVEMLRTGGDTYKVRC